MGPDRGARPNVVLLVFDTARADAFEPYGAAAGSSPAFAQLASSGVALKGYAPSSWTVPSHVSMFSGKLPRAAGLSVGPLEAQAAHRAAIADVGPLWLPSFMAQAGYSTAAISANGWVAGESGFDRGFQRFEWVRSQRPPSPSGRHPRAHLRWDLHAIRRRLDDGADEVDRLLDQWLASGPDAPFFWFVNLVECHSPYLPPSQYNDLSPWLRWKAGRDAANYLTMEGIWRTSLKRTGAPTVVLERMRHLYRRSILLLDDWLARFLERLDSAGLLDETLIIVTSDHGENLGEGGLLGHSFSVDERLMRVPLAVRGPGAASVIPSAGSPLSLVDLPSLVLGAAGIDNHPWNGCGDPWRDLTARRPAVGQLEPLVALGDPRVEVGATAFDLNEEECARLTDRVSTATDGHHKVLRVWEQDFAIDLVADPLEKVPRLLRPHEVQDMPWKPLRQALDEAAQASLPQASGIPNAAGPMSAELESQLRLLGYM